MQGIRLTALAALFASAAGCQCCSLTEHYQDTIDHVADHQPHLDRFYCPGLDLTRIGYPDWCQYSFNRWLYGDCCCRDTRQQPAYIHNPMYSPEDHVPRMEPIPEGAQIPPRDDVGPDSRGQGNVPTQMKGRPDPKDLDRGDLLPPLPAITPPPISPPEFPGNSPAP